MPNGEYLTRHKGQTVFVCGSAPCLLTEYEEAKIHRPDAKVIAINEAGSGVWADFLVSYHAEKFGEFKGISLNPNITTHTSRAKREDDKFVDYYWPEIWIGATSAGDAIQIARKMGFSEIIMIGCPMNGGDGYFNKTGGGGACPRFGAPRTLLGENRDMIQNHKNKLVVLKDKIDLSIVKSMSGYSSEVFGKPEWS